MPFRVVPQNYTEYTGLRQSGPRLQVRVYLLVRISVAVEYVHTHPQEVSSKNLQSRYIAPGVSIPYRGTPLHYERPILLAGQAGDTCQHRIIASSRICLVSGISGYYSVRCFFYLLVKTRHSYVGTMHIGTYDKDGVLLSSENAVVCISPFRFPTTTIIWSQSRHLSPLLSGSS